jgi:NhaP-type Na+/H+ or K+/H+ antiporter
LCLAQASVLLFGAPAYADVVPPLTGVLDFLWLGPVGAIVAGLLLITAAVLFFRRLRRRGRGRLFAAAAALGLFVVGNVICYVLAVNPLRGGGHRPDIAIPPSTAGQSR